MKTWQKNRFRSWLNMAIIHEHTYNACVLSTVNNNIPSARVVLLKGVLNEGFVFYTNYESDKAVSIENNPAVSLLFFWPVMDRQVRILGEARKISEEESDKYFNSRPYLSRIGAWASQQSRPMKRSTLIFRVLHFIYKFKSHVPRPAHWGGYLIEPSSIEYWIGMKYRLHTRIRYRKDNDWEREVLAP